MKKSIAGVLLFAWTFINPFICDASPALLRKRVLADLESIRNIFEVKYAPLYWKQEYAKWDLDLAIDEAKNQVVNLPSPTVKDCQVILRDFFNSTCDYHVGARFYSTENASLPFIVKGSQGRYFISFVDRELVNKQEFPFEVGDEILQFSGRPVDEVVQELRIQEYGSSNTLETNQALAEMTLTNRRGEMGHRIPQGTVQIQGIKKESLRPSTVYLKWSYTPEKIRDFSKLGLAVHVDSSHKGLKELQTQLKKSRFFEKFMTAHFWDKSYVGSSLTPNQHTLGSRTSFIPKLGDKLWESGEDALFDAYMFRAPSGKLIGYVRIPHYMGDEEELYEFGELMNYFEDKTDALIIDQVNNPGGSVFYLYALVSTLTDRSFDTPKHHLSLTQEEVHLACQLLPHLEQAHDDRTSRFVLGDTLGGYPVDYQFVKLMRQFCNFLIEQWNAGKLYSDPTYLYGVDEINPHPEYHYSKPILLLINSLDFSGGDFFPAILQDNQRATLLGTRTAGAGGYVIAAEFPNHSGLKGFSLTGSLAERKDKKPIENLGVNPDIFYDVTAVDLQQNYKDYVTAILEAVENLQ